MMRDIGGALLYVPKCDVGGGGKKPSLRYVILTASKIKMGLLLNIY